MSYPNDEITITPRAPSLKQRLEKKRDELTPKGRLLADFVEREPRRAVFMRTRELAEASKVSEATVIRFVGRLGYKGYAEFIQALRDLVDAEMTIVDRVEISARNGSGADKLGKVIYHEITNLKKLYDGLDMDAIRSIVAGILSAREIYVAGSRLSYTFAYYLGWSLTKLRPGVFILPGSDTTTIDRLCTLPDPALVIILTVARYPNDLIKLSKAARRYGHKLIVITDSALSPVIPFAHQSFITPSSHFPVIGSPSAIHCFVNCLVHEILNQGGDEVRQHLERQEKTLMEYDLLFNLE